MHLHIKIKLIKGIVKEPVPFSKAGIFFFILLKLVIMVTVITVQQLMIDDEFYYFPWYAWGI